MNDDAMQWWQQQGMQEMLEKVFQQDIDNKAKSDLDKSGKDNDNSGNIRSTKTPF